MKSWILLPTGLFTNYQSFDNNKSLQLVVDGNNKIAYFNISDYLVPLVSPAGWASTVLQGVNNAVDAGGLANDSRLALEFEFVRQGRINRALSGNFLQPIENILRTISKTGKVLGGVGVIISGVDMAVNGVNASNFLDLAFGAVAFVPGFGWAVSGLYVVSNWGVEMATGKDIGQHIQGALITFKY